jgi:hypothetical protein
LSDYDRLIHRLDLRGFPAMEAGVEGLFGFGGEGEPLNKVVEAHGFGLALSIYPQEGVSYPEAGLFYGQGYPMKEAWAGKGEKETAGFEEPKKLLGYGQVPGIEPFALGRVEAHAWGEVLHLLALVGLRGGFFGGPSVVQLI